VRCPPGTRIEESEAYFQRVEDYIRQVIPADELAVINDNIGLHMSPNPLSVAPDTLASDALQILNDNAVSVLFVVEGETLVGIVHIHDIVRAGTA